MRSFTTKGNAVEAYTGSPSRAFLVEIACARDNGIFVPAGITATFGSGSSASDAPAGAAVNSFPCALESDGGAPAELVGTLVGFAISAACPHAIPETRSTANSARMQASLNPSHYSTPSLIPGAIGCNYNPEMRLVDNLAAQRAHRLRRLRDRPQQLAIPLRVLSSAFGAASRHSLVLIPFGEAASG